MLERALEHVGDDLHVAVRVRAEAAAGRDAVVVDDAQRAEPHVRRVVVVAEGERVPAVEPTDARAPALGAATNLDHVVILPRFSCSSRPTDASPTSVSRSTGLATCASNPASPARGRDPPPPAKPVSARANGLAAVLWRAQRAAISS